MTAALAAPSLGVHPLTAVLGIAAGAVGAAALGGAGTHAPAVSSSSVTTVTTVAADLHLTAGSTPAGAAAVAPVTADATSAAATVPELTKAAGLQAQARKVDAAIERFESKIGSTTYENWCERAVENAFGTQGHYASAIQDWESQQQHTDWRHAPRGAMVFYDTSSDGHVALSLGDGRVVSSSAHHQVGIVPVDYFQRPLGWAYAPY
ncbi:hypothetical protein [Actinomycetospora soli]|uniref:hypothetical protein n=1 Tax=Actinomycetospora soli TaxID=2893887 RepID=UPI001E54FF69|nr:hypothetical protein [Actinomycetospora soli]MCD2185906.1 hypothetical protein [Actinomycetospora soli]